jgi:hypothetical protein
MKSLIHPIFLLGPVKCPFITDLGNVDGIHLSWESAEVFFFTLNLRSWIVARRIVKNLINLRTGGFISEARAWNGLLKFQMEIGTRISPAP